MPAVIRRSKRYREREKTTNRLQGQSYSLEDAIKAVKKIQNPKYDETLALDFQLGIRPEQNDEAVRGTVSLPHGTGQKVRVICFCKGEGVRQAEAAGADVVGAEELVQKIQGGWLDFDAVVSHPDMMREVSKLGRILGPKGLMPSPKAGTVTPDVARAVKELKAGRIEFKNDKTGGLHAVCGKMSFTENALIENARVVIRAVRDAKPAASKGEYLKRVTIAPSQGPGFRLATGTL